MTPPKKISSDSRISPMKIHVWYLTGTPESGDDSGPIGFAVCVRVRVAGRFAAELREVAMWDCRSFWKFQLVI
jgi:hypothetical protein